MGSNQAVYESFDQVELTLKSGVPVRGRALELGGPAGAIHFLRLWEVAQQEEDGVAAAEAIRVLLDEFPKAAGIESARITPFELFGEVLPAFLFRGGAWTPTLNESEAELQPSSTSGSMI